MIITSQKAGIILFLLVEAGDAEKKQVEAFEKIQAIMNDIKENESYISGASEYKNTKIGEIDFSRLYTFLKAIHENKYDRYIEQNHVETVEEDK